MMPHMHVRGKDMTYHLVYPDGRDEVVLSVPKYDFNWQMLLPAGEADSRAEGHEDARRRALRQLDGEPVQPGSEPDGLPRAG